MSALDAELAKMATRVVTHMNDDRACSTAHFERPRLFLINACACADADSCLAWAHYYAKLPSATSARMTGIDARGFMLDVTLPDGHIESCLIPYSPPLTEAKMVRKIAVAMHFEAYNGMGLGYKLSNGFYSGAAKQAWTHMPAKVRTGFKCAAAVAVFAVVYKMARR